MMPVLFIDVAGAKKFLPLLLIFLPLKLFIHSLTIKTLRWYAYLQSVL